MIIQPAILLSKQQTQPDRQCLYAWDPQGPNPTATVASLVPCSICMPNSLEQHQSEQNSALTSACDSSKTSSELLQRYKQSVAPSARAYHSNDTIDEALNPPWALHYELKRRPATPNLSSNTTDMSVREEAPRRLKSAPLVRFEPVAPALIIPEPRFLMLTNSSSPMATPPPPPPTRPKSRASSAKAHPHVSTIPRHAKSAQGPRRKEESKLSDAQIQQILKKVYGDQVEQPPPEQPIQIIYTQPSPQPVPPSPVYIYQKSASWCPDHVSSPPSVPKSIEVSAVPLNPHYIHRPGVIAIKNVEKNSVVRASSASRRPSKYHRRYHHSHGGRNEPLRATAPASQKPRLTLEIDGVKLTHDPKLTLEDKSSNLTKYFIDGRLYLIKQQRYNVFENIDPSKLAKYNQQLTSRPSSSKHHQIGSVVPKSASSNHLHRYVIDPNLITENLNVNRMSLATRPVTATVFG